MSICVKRNKKTAHDFNQNKITEKEIISRHLYLVFFFGRDIYIWSKQIKYEVFILRAEDQNKIKNNGYKSQKYLVKKKVSKYILIQRRKYPFFFLQEEVVSISFTQSIFFYMIGSIIFIIMRMSQVIFSPSKIKEDFILFFLKERLYTYTITYSHTKTHIYIIYEMYLYYFLIKKGKVSNLPISFFFVIKLVHM